MDKIETIIIKVNKQNPEKALIKKGADIIKSGGLVAFPTETVYGLGANGLDEKAVKKIFIAKGRPQDNPLILHVAEKDQVSPLVEFISKEAEELMEKFWPGPLTLLFKRSKLVPDCITAGLDTVAIRMPNHPVALALIKASDVPIAAPSANTSGKPSPTLASHVKEDLYGKIHMIIDGGKTGIGVESTVLDMSGDKPLILRPGGVTLEQLREILPYVEEDLSIIKDDENIVPKSPGQKYKHYAPKGEMYLFIGNLDNIVNAIDEYANKYIELGKKVGIMATDETKSKYNKGIILSLGTRKNKEAIARNLFSTLRKFDEKGVDIILAEGVDSQGIGKAIMNRMKKAAGGNIIRV
ncbi:L-threonylcarbamoyladenylate synthase [Keratinibaculum paraultunense]|uniref:Threonylcarbamoyl-AMP synthase n=1 Tax=Keratinibaculum paraultunense TaxID=1278232 RepID=A0A4R3KTS3_9FIRM|nr:L-threonylcarbamoyladenylate synthase [Keratinibaculum paraultunense]QQY79190.1 threonylcarbamoyl-AMP synthase [Keratinibaculum paraultunense]TCS88574.1 L-threonylcarbamoyladenylate synthase [Keratinibaculum paraultunense]